MRVALLLSMLALPGCAQLGAALANLPTAFADVTREAGIAYGPEPWQKLDVYRPADAADGDAGPALVFVHGGNWRQGRKGLYRFVGARFAEHGYTVVVPDYRKYPPHRYPGFVEDAALAVKWTTETLAPDGVFLSDHSAGAHTAAMLSLDERYLRAVGLAPGAIRAVAGLAGPYAFTPEDADHRAIFGPPDAYPEMRAPNFVDGGEPPTLLLHGAADEVVSVRNTRDLAAALAQAGVPHAVEVYPGVDHLGIVAALTWLGDGIAPVERDMLTFFARYGGPAPEAAARHVSPATRADDEPAR